MICSSLEFLVNILLWPSLVLRLGLMKSRKPCTTSSAYIYSCQGGMNQAKKDSQQGSKCDSHHHHWPFLWPSSLVQWQHCRQREWWPARRCWGNSSRAASMSTLAPRWSQSGWWAGMTSSQCASWYRTDSRKGLRHVMTDLVWCASGIRKAVLSSWIIQISMIALVWIVCIPSLHLKQK